MKKSFGSKREKKEAMEIDITSLLDILVILLVFLLKSYNASDLKVNVVKNLTVPDSKARKLGSHSVIVQVDKSHNIYINNTLIGRVPASSSSIPSLESELNKQKEKLQTTTSKEKKNRKVNLVFHEEVPYEVMQKVMHTSALSGFTQFKFIVQGNY